MIRDPSDGTIRPTIKPVMETGTSGLATDRLKAEEIARLEKSRDWLKGWFNRRAEQTDSVLRSTESGEG